MKVTNLEHINQFEITVNEGWYFQSYDSICAFIDLKSGTLTLGPDWDYSQTTLKHLYLFISSHLVRVEGECLPLDYLLNYAKNKKAYIQKLLKQNKIKYDSNLGGDL